jgi:hypothetical protein
MALQGNCTHSVLNDTGQTEEVTRIHDDGSVETFNTPVLETISTNYENVYVQVKQVEFFQRYNSDGKKQIVLFHVAGYESKEVRDANIEDFLFFYNLELEDYDYNSNLLTQCYNLIKTTEGFENLTDI